MEDPPAPRQPAAGACIACRRLKMKCLRSKDAPCIRCLKAGRECVIPISRRRGPKHIREETAASSSTPTQLEENEIHAGPNFSVPSNSQNALDPGIRGLNSPASSHFAAGNTALPSIYSTSPYATIVEQNGSHTPDNGQIRGESLHGSLTGRRTDSVSFSATSTGPINSNRDSLGRSLQASISDGVLAQYIQLFIQHVLVYLPIIELDDLQDVDQLVVEKKFLARSIAFVMTKFVPGGDVIRARLSSEISIFLQHVCDPVKRSTEEEFSVLQALAILYAYRSVRSERRQENHINHIEEESHLPVKALMETCALKFSLHRSIEGVRAALQNQSADVIKTISYRKYIFWLWLFTASYHFSVVTGTPPTIPEDATIRSAPALLSRVESNHRTLWILGQVELCLVWGKVSAHERGLGEWWCPVSPLDETPNSSDMIVLAEIDAALETWSNKWLNFTSNTENGPGLEFHFLFTRFCLISYSTRHLGVSGSSLRTSQRQFLKRSIVAAVGMCSFILDLGPVAKDALRFTADFGLVMVAFCCTFVIEAYKAFSSLFPDLVDNLKIAEAVARLMLELSSSNPGPAQYGRMILTRLENIQIPIDLRAFDADVEQAGTPFSGTFIAGLEDAFMTDNFWGLPMLSQDSVLYE